MIQQPPLPLSLKEKKENKYLNLTDLDRRLLLQKVIDKLMIDNNFFDELKRLL